MPQAINLLPDEKQSEVKVNPYLDWFVKTGAVFLFFAYLLVLGAFAYRWYQENQIEKINTEITKNRNEIVANTEFISDFNTLQEQYRQLQNYYDDYNPFLQYFVVLENTIPLPVNIDNLLLQSDSMSISAKTTDYIAINQWQNDLKNADEVKTVELTSVQQQIDEITGEEKISFAFEIKLNQQIEAADQTEE